MAISHTGGVGQYKVQIFHNILQLQIMSFLFLVILIPFCTVYLYIYNNERTAFKGINLVVTDKHV